MKTSLLILLAILFLMLGTAIYFLIAFFVKIWPFKKKNPNPSPTPTPPSPTPTPTPPTPPPSPTPPSPKCDEKSEKCYRQCCNTCPKAWRCDSSKVGACNMECDKLKPDDFNKYCSDLFKC